MTHPPPTNLQTILILIVAAVLLGTWELLIIRMASVYYFTSVTHLVLAVSLLGFSAGAILARNERYQLSVTVLVTATLIGLPPCWWLLSAHDFAWGAGVFALPFVTFGAASTLAWRQLSGQRDRAMLYLGESTGTVLGLILTGPLVISLLPVNVLGSIGFDNHLRVQVAKEGLKAHTQVTTAYATTDMIRTTRPSVVYYFTDARFVTRSVQWDGNSRHFDDPDIENLARLKRLALSSSSLEETLLLGAGAGFDMALALQEGAGEIDAVEVNPETIALARTLEPWSGGVLGNARVTMHIAEARRFISVEPRRWDHINLTLLQTSPSTGRATSHVDARVLTREAISAYLQHLKPLGTLAIIQNSSMLADRTRATILSVIDSPEQLREWQLPTHEHKENPFNHLLLVRNEIFPEKATRELDSTARSLGLEGNQWMSSELQVTRAVSSQVTTDDRPFLFESPMQLLFHAFTALALAATVLLAIFLRARQQTGHIRLAGSAALVGTVLMAMQVLIIYRVQAALGNPGLAMSVALGASLIGAGTGAFLLHSVKPLANWRGAGLIALAGCLTFAVSSEAAVGLALRFETSTAALFMSSFIIVCSLPMGLPFLAVMDRAKTRYPNTEALVIACDGIGGVFGAATATAVTTLLGFSWLAATLVILMAIFAVARPRG